MPARQHLHTCMLCEAACGVVLTVEDERITSVRGDDDDPFSRGYICPKAAAIGDVAADPDRIREPMRRDGDTWAPVEWDAALDEAAANIARIQRQHGPNAVGIYVGNPTVHSYGAALAYSEFGRLLGTRSRFSATSVDQLPHMLAALEMLGHQLRFSVPDVDRTGYLLMLGANPLASNGSMMTAPGIKRRLEALRERGGTLVVVDPRRTETAGIADRHIPIRPGTDALWLLALLHVVFAEGLDDLGRLAAFTDGLDEIRAIAKRFPPERVDAATGIDADLTRRIATDFARAPSAVCYGRMGACTQAFGGLSIWLCNVLNVVTGNFDREGGSMLPSPAADLVALPESVFSAGHYGIWRSRVRGLPEFGGELPVAVLSEEIETPGEGQIRALITVAGNPVLSTPNGGRLARALSELEYMVSVDIYRNETTRHANVILPTRFGPERDHYDLALYLLSVRNAARYVSAALEPPPGVRDEFDLLLDLGLRIHAAGGGKRKLGRTIAPRVMRRLGARRILDFMLRNGPHGGLFGAGGLSIAALKKSPHGVDLGPLQPRLPGALENRERCLHLAPALFIGDVPRLEASLSATAHPMGLSLIGRRHLRSNNSWMHNSRRLVKGPPRCTLMMHPRDAEARGLETGATVLVRSRVGEVRAPLEVTDAVAPGVVSLPHGWGHGRAGAALTVAAETPGVSINDLTDDEAVDALSGNASLSGILVEVEAVVEDAASEHPVQTEVTAPASA